MAELLAVEPVFAQRLWGGSGLRRIFGAAVPNGVIGECWAVSGMAGMSGAIRSGAPAGITLREAWAHGLVTGEAEEGDFPLLCKFLDPQDWLSVQVHPNGDQARDFEGEPRGKAECWLVVSCQPHAELILGHTAQTPEQLRTAAIDGTLSDLLVHVNVRPDDFFMIAPGVVHSLGPGMLVYEVQQSSDITYRLYDFDRVDLDGRKRELHTDKGFSVVTAPHDPSVIDTSKPWQSLGSRGRTRVLVQCPEFTVRRWDLAGQSADLTAPDYRVVTVIGGSGRISAGGTPVALGLGTSVVIPRGAGDVRLTGSLVAVTTDPGPDVT